MIIVLPPGASYLFKKKIISTDVEYSGMYEIKLVSRLSSLFIDK